MSRSKTIRPDSSATARRVFSENDPDDQTKARQWLDQLAAIREYIAPLVIAKGLHEGDDWVWPVAEFLGQMDILNEIQALEDRLHHVYTDVDTTVPSPLEGSPDHRDPLGDAAVSLGIAFGNAGYLLGLAVGMQLGPDALKGGAR